MRVPSHIYSKDLMRIMMKVRRQVGDCPHSESKRKPVPEGFDTNELVNQMREEMGI